MASIAKFSFNSEILIVARKSFHILVKQDRRKLLLITAIQIFSGFLDLIGIAVIGALGALVVSGFGAGQTGERVLSFIKILHLQGLSFQSQVAVLGVCAALLLVVKTVFSVLFTRRTLFFLSRRSALVSTQMISKLLNQELIKIQERSIQDHIFIVTTGINTIMLGILGAFVSILADLSLLLIIAFGLFLVDPVVALATVGLFLSIGLSLYWLMSHRASLLGNENSTLSVAINDKISEALFSYRESFVRNRRSSYAGQIGNMRMNFADNLAEMQFMPMISKYVIEASVIVGAVAISAIQFMMQNATHAVATLAVFLAAGSRIAPAVMRVQQSAIQIKSSVGAAGSTILFIRDLESELEVEHSDDELDLTHSGFVPSVLISNVNFTYPNSLTPALNKINLEIQPGQLIALVGESGAGKSTLADLILGILDPDSGFVSISGIPPKEAIERFQGAFGYVPQEISITGGTVRENLALGFNPEQFAEEHYWDILQISELEKVVTKLPLLLDSEVGERGSRLSGGQRQRLGIARALITSPKLIVLDEATSALDGQTEASISSAIKSLKGKVTVILIAHRLSTARDADVVVYMEQGRVVTTGTFSQVRVQVPEFDSQARLMGL